MRCSWRLQCHNAIWPFPLKLQSLLEDHKRQELERKYAVRYHKVKFFERVKLERRIRHKEKEVAGATGAEREARAEELRRLWEDLNYVLHFPKGEKYVSILGESVSAWVHVWKEREGWGAGWA